MIVKLLTEHHLGFLSLKGGCRGSSESKHVKMSHRWKSQALAHNYYIIITWQHTVKLCETPSEWCFAGGPIVAQGGMLAGQSVRTKIM